MTISNTTNRRVYTGPGDEFTYDFPVFHDADIYVVIVQDEAPTQIVPDLDGADTYDFSVSGTFDSTALRYPNGVTVTLNNPLPDNTYTIAIECRPAQTQSTDYVNGGPLNAERLETDFDRLVTIAQYTVGEVESAVRVSPTADISIPPLVPQANAILVWDSDGEAIVNRSVFGRWRDVWATDTLYVELDIVRFEEDGDAKDGNLYLCAEEHESDVFDTDLAAGRWQLIIDVAAVENAKDAAEAAQTAAETAETNAAASESAAATSETNAAASESAAATSETNAAASETLAEQWASEDEDVVVADGKFSSYHWAQKTEDYAAMAVADEDVIFPNVSSVELADIPAGVQALFVQGYTSAGDGGGALYKRVGSEPSHVGRIQSSDGTWWELVETRPNVLQFGAIADASIVDEQGETGVGKDNTDAFNNALSFVSEKYGSGIVDVPVGDYRCASTILIPEPDSNIGNTELVAGMQLRGEGKVNSRIFYDSDTGFAIESEHFDSVQGPRFGVFIEHLAVFGKPHNSAEGGIRLRNPRQGSANHLHVYGFPEGDGLVVRGAGLGGAWHFVVDNCYFGHDLFTQENYPEASRIWLDRCIVFEGDWESGAGDINETTVTNTYLASFKSTGIDYSSPFLSTPPDPDQSVADAGGAQHTVDKVQGYSGTLRTVKTPATGDAEGTAQSGTSNTITLRSDDVATDDFYNGLTITITQGTGAGQHAPILDYDGTTKELTIDGSWDTTPDGTSQYIIGYRMDGIRWSHRGHITVTSASWENVTNPYHFVHSPAASAENNVTIIGGRMDNSSVAAGVVSDARVPLIGGLTALGGSASTIEFPSDGSTLSEFYKGRIVFINGGTGSGQRRLITRYDGDTRTATVFPDWDTAPASDSVFWLEPGQWPSTLLQNQSRGLRSDRYDTPNYTSEWIAPANILQVNAGDDDNSPADFYTNPTSWQTIYRNASGATLSQGDVVRASTSGKTVVTTTNANAPRPMVVAGAASDEYAANTPVPIARSGSEVLVNVTGDVSARDTLVTSTTAGEAVEDNTETNPKNILGYALENVTGGGTILAVIS